MDGGSGILGDKRYPCHPDQAGGFGVHGENSFFDE
jgi:hypothetical protein